MMPRIAVGLAERFSIRDPLYRHPPPVSLPIPGCESPARVALQVLLEQNGSLSAREDDGSNVAIHPPILTFARHRIRTSVWFIVGAVGGKRWVRPAAVASM